MNRRKLSLTTAVAEGDTEAVQALLAGGSDVNKPTSGGQTPLILAIVFRRIQILSLLLEAGGDPQLRDSLGLNAVDWAERRGFTEGVKVLAQTRTAPQKTRPPATSPEAKNLRHSVPTQIKEQSPPASKGSEQCARSDEKSLLWIAGLKRRIEAETSNKVKEVQLESSRTEEAEGKPKTVQPHVVVDHGTLPVQLPSPEFVESPERTTKVAPETYQLKNESYSEGITPVVPRDALEKSQQSTSTIRTPSMPSNIKRCPKCNAIYNSELLWYCAIDMAPLVDANKPIVAPPPETAGMPSVWFLVVFVFVVAGGIAYFLIPNFKGEQDAKTGLSPAQAIKVRSSPLVEGELSGKQVNVPEAQYPESAKSARVSGTVTVQISVDKNGNVIATKVVDGDRRLRSAAIAAARKATFSPEKLMGRGAIGTIAYIFRE